MVKFLIGLAVGYIFRDNIDEFIGYPDAKKTPETPDVPASPESTS